MAGLEVAGQSGRRDCRPAAGSPSREAPRHGQWEQSLRPRAPKPVRRRPVLATTGWESSISAAQSRTSPLRSRTNMQSTQAARSADSTFSRLSKGLDGTVRVSRTIRVTPSAQSGQPAPSVSYVVTTVEKEDELSQGSSLASASFTQPAPKTAWLEQEEHNNTAAERTFVGRAESKNGGAEPSSLLSLLRSRHESARPTGAEQSVSFAPASPETRLQQSTDRVLEESAGEPERDIQRSAVPSAGKVRRQRFGKGLRRPPTALKRARPWVVESATDSRAPVDPSQAVPIERRMLRCGVLLLRWTVRKQRGLARWWFMESLQLQDNEVSETSTQFARARAKQSISASNRSSSQRSARSAEKLAAEGGWAGSRTGAEQALTTRQKATRAESSAFDQAMAAALRRKSVLKWAFVALRSDVTVRLLSRAVASCSCCARDGRRLLRGWMSLHANWLASVESMRVAHAQRNWLCRSQLRRMIRVWQQRAEWCVPRRRKAASHNNICSRARTLNRLALAAAFSRCKRTLMSVSVEWRGLVTVGAALGAWRAWAAKHRSLRDKEARVTFGRHQRASESDWPERSTSSVQRPKADSGRRSPPWLPAPRPPAPTWEIRARRSTHRRLQAVAADAIKHWIHSSARRRQRPVVLRDAVVDTPADKRIRAKEAMAARVRADLLNSVLGSGGVGRNDRSSTGRQADETLRERVAALHKQWRELDDRGWQDAGTKWLAAPPPSSSVLRAAAWWRWRRALWGGLRDELLDDLNGRRRQRTYMLAWHQHTKLVLERRKQAAAMAKLRLSAIGRKRVWFDRFASQAARSCVAVSMARQRILMRYATSRWARHTANIVLRRQIWREACMHHVWLLRKQSIRAWRKFVLLRAETHSRSVQARILGEAALWRWVWKRWQATQCARKLLYKVFGEALRRRELMDAAHGSPDWRYRILKSLIKHWKDCTRARQDASRKRVRRQMAFEYAHTCLLMRSVAAWRNGATVRSAARAVRIFTQYYRLRRALSTWKANLRELATLLQAAHYTQLRRRTLQGWWTYVWLHRYARPMAHASSRMVCIAFSALRQHLLTQYGCYSPWRHNVMSLHWKRWKRQVLSSRELLLGAVRSGNLRKVRACINRWRIGTLARVWSQHSAVDSSRTLADFISNVAAPARAHRSIDVGGVPSPTERCYGRPGRNVHDYMLWMRQTDQACGHETRCHADVLHDGWEPPSGCRLPLRHDGSFGGRCKPPAELTEATLSAAADKIYHGCRIGNGWIEPGPYALDLPRQPPKLRVWSSQWMAERVGQATQRALHGSAVLTQPSAESVAAAVAEAARHSAVPPCGADRQAGKTPTQR